MLLTFCNEDGGKEICELPPEAGPCEAYSEQFFYNSTSETCEQFVYGGCNGNANRFPTEKECQEMCIEKCEFLMPVLILSISLHCLDFTPAS